MTLAIYILRCLYLKRVIDIEEFNSWFIESPKMQIFWVVFFSVISSFFTTILLISDGDVFSRGWWLLLSLDLMMILSVIGAIFNIRVHEKTKIIIKEIPITPSSLLNPCEFIYVLRREDGIIKIGRTGDIDSRIHAHEKDYNAKFSILASWVVFDSEAYEKIALSMTGRFAYSEGNRRELRQMNNDDLSGFILDFSKKVQNGIRSNLQ